MNELRVTCESLSRRKLFSPVRPSLRVKLSLNVFSTGVPTHWLQSIAYMSFRLKVYTTKDEADEFEIGFLDEFGKYSFAPPATRLNDMENSEDYCSDL